MDQKKENIIVIGAINTGINILDKDLLSLGRFDKKIIIDKPNLEEKEELFKILFIKKKK